jgi:hypothetical protein
LQWLSYWTAEFDMLAYVEATQPARFKVAMSKLTWDVTYTPPSDQEPAPVETIRAREPVPHQIAPSDFSQGRQITVNARFIPFDEPIITATQSAANAPNAAGNSGSVAALNDTRRNRIAGGGATCGVPQRSPA